MHLLNACSPIEVTEEEVEIWVSDEHFLKDSRPIDVINDWIMIWVNAEHLSNEYFPIYIFINSGSIIISESDVHSFNILRIIGDANNGIWIFFKW